MDTKKMFEIKKAIANMVGWNFNSAQAICKLVESLSED